MKPPAKRQEQERFPVWEVPLLENCLDFDLAEEILQFFTEGRALFLLEGCHSVNPWVKHPVKS